MFDAIDFLAVMIESNLFGQRSIRNLPILAFRPPSGRSISRYGLGLSPMELARPPVAMRLGHAYILPVHHVPTRVHKQGEHSFESTIHRITLSIRAGFLTWRSDAGRRSRFGACGRGSKYMQNQNPYADRARPSLGVFDRATGRWGWVCSASDSLSAAHSKKTLTGSG